MPRVPEQGIAATRTPIFTLPEEFDEDPWSDFKDRFTQIEAVVIDNYISGCDPVLCVRTRDGRNWTIELANHSRNDEVGLTESAAMPGDRVMVIGRRTRHFGEYRVKATQLTIAGKVFDLYPDLVA